MFELSPLILGITLLGLGMTFVLLILGFSRIVPSLRPRMQISPQNSSVGEEMLPSTPGDIRAHNDAVLLIRPGGRILYANQQAQQWLGSEKGVLDLEHLARRAYPSDTFLSLCASEGRARFSVDDHIVEGLSYIVPHNDSAVMLVSLQHVLLAERETQPGKEAIEGGAPAGLEQTIAPRRDLETTLQIILQNVERQISFDLAEITVWDTEEEHLIPYRLVGSPSADRRPEKKRERYRSGEGYSGHLIAHRTPLLITNVETDGQETPSRTEQKDSFRSYLGAPLLVGDELVGTLELGSLSTAAYDQDDLDLLRSLTNQIAIILQNVWLHTQGQRRTAQLASLAQLAQSLVTGSQTHDVYAALLKMIMPLVNVEILGLLIYDASRSALEAQNPFFGLPAEFADLYRVEMPAGSEAEVLWLAGETIVAKDAAEDPHLQTLGLHHAARAAGMRDSVLVPLVSAGRNLGYLQAANPKNRPSFEREDLQLLTIIAGQIAPVVENTLLSERSRPHVLRAGTLLRVTAELSAGLDLEHVLDRTLMVLNEVVNAEQVTCLVKRQGETKLRHLASIGYTSSPPPDGRPSPFDPDEGLAGWVISNRQAVLVSDVLRDERWVHLPGQVTQHRSAIGAPLMVGEELLGALLFFHRRPGHFSTDQLDLVRAAANQVAVAIHNADLYNLLHNQAKDLGMVLRDQQIGAIRSQAILEAVAEGVLVTDAFGKITLFNASAERILNLERGRVLGRSFEHFIGLFGKAALEWMKTIRSWSNDPSLYHPGDVYADQITLEDGRVVSVYLAPVLLQDEFLGTVSIFHDITHQVEVDRLKSEFVAAVSHELRTPLTSIKGYVELLLKGAAGALDDQQTRFMKVVGSNTDRLAILVDELLDISRLEASRLTLNMQPLDLRLLAEEAMNDLRRRSQAEGKSMIFAAELPPSLPPVLGDAERVRQILSNLLINAYQYTPENGQITLHVRQTGDEVQVDVRDNGIGVPPAAQAHVFERFYRGEDPLVLATSGTGLGLPIVKHLVEMHGGAIWLTSSGVPGEGSTFSFSLPVHKSS